MGKARREEQALRRIVMMLAALAVLAERAAGRSFPVRWFVLAVLRRGEAAAMAWVAEATGTDWSDDDDPQAGSGPVDAILLALRLRALAAVLAGCLAPVPGASRRQVVQPGAPHGGAPSPCPPRVAHCNPAPPICDSS